MRACFIAATRARGRFLKYPPLDSVLSHFWPDGAWWGGVRGDGRAVQGATAQILNIPLGRAVGEELRTGSGRNQNKGKSGSNPAKE